MGADAGGWDPWTRVDCPSNRAGMASELQALFRLCSGSVVYAASLIEFRYQYSTHSAGANKSMSICWSGGRVIICYFCHTLDFYRDRFVPNGNCSYWIFQPQWTRNVNRGLMLHTTNDKGALVVEWKQTAFLLEKSDIMLPLMWINMHGRARRKLNSASLRLVELDCTRCWDQSQPGIQRPSVS